MNRYRRYGVLCLYFSLVLLTQLLVTQLRSYWIGEDQATLSVLIVNHDKGGQGEQLVALLRNEKYVDVQMDTRWTSEDYVSTKENIVLVIPETFTKKIQNQHVQNLVSLYLTPGIQDSQIALDMIQSNLLTVIASETYKSASGKEWTNLDQTKLFQVEYHDESSKEKIYGSNQKTISLPLIGLAYLPLLLFIVETLPSAHNKRLKFYGYKIILREQFLYFSILTFLFLAESSLFVGIQFYFFQRLMTSEQLLHLVFLYLYIAMVSFCLSYFTRTKGSYYGFIPWFILNLTIAGGLFETTIVPRSMSFILPIQNLTTRSFFWSKINMLFAMLLVGIVIAKTIQNTKHKNTKF